MALVAGIDSSTQSCKVVIRDADSGTLVRQGTAPHPPETEIDPEHWWTALRTAVERAGGLGDVAAVSVAAQQHGMIALDHAGQVIRPALLWNDTRSAAAAADLVAEWGAERWAAAVGLVPVASFTVTKLRWLADHEPDAAARIAAVVLPHDWLTWRLSGARSLDTLRTDRSDASGTGYFDAVSNAYRRDVLALALRREPGGVERITLPTVTGPEAVAGRGDAAAGWGHLLLGPGCGDNAGATLGLGLRPGEALMSLGTSGVVATVAAATTRDATGAVAGFADATGRHLPLACTLNASRVLDATAALLGVGHDELSRLALSAQPGAAGLVLVPYLEGERTPNLPTATGSLHGLTPTSMTPANLARAAVEGVLCLMAGCLDALRAQGVRIDRVTLVGGGARSRAVQEIAPAILGIPVAVPAPGEYVADGAARQAATVLARTDGATPPSWSRADAVIHRAEPLRFVLDRYREVAATVTTTVESRRG
ncbi:xylulokinase [Frankia sp. Mgl5]|uniref:xylulokinase n=1 Tax=Frankia sp. Mgl5 TaxID=2933793 RepID=UPI00200E4829|nr:xylulokinase [Frankia sp. Mgl5]MCK9930222.1 xylulokinase [Frankia sp. Mgl5]